MKKGRASSPPSGTDWDRVDRLKDEEIDFSDLLEIPPEKFAQALVRKGLEPSPEARIQLAVYRYQTKEDLSLAKAAELAGVSWVQMREILLEKGISPKLGPETIEEAEREAGALRDFLANR